MGDCPRLWGLPLEGGRVQVNSCFCVTYGSFTLGNYKLTHNKLAPSNQSYISKDGDSFPNTGLAMRNTCHHKHVAHLAADSQSSPASSPEHWLETDPSQEPDHSRNPHNTAPFFLSGNSLACINRCPCWSFFTSGVRDKARDSHRAG